MSGHSPQSTPLRLARLPLLLISILALLAALWAGWIRLGWQWPVLQPALPVAHGPLMVTGFLGTLIALEQVVALQKRWMYLAPVLSGLGGLLLIMGVKGLPGPTLLTGGSLGLVVIFIVILRRHFALYTLAMAAGSAALLVGNLLWLFGAAIPQVVLWWMTFLVLTIAGERLELGRLLRLSMPVQRLFISASSLMLAGLLLQFFDPALGARLFWIGLLGLGVWLLRYDLATHTVRQAGLPRFAAICLLSGFFWLVIGGLLGAGYGYQVAGPYYDAMLHAAFVGFVISMIFGHAPIIFPAVLGLQIRFTPLFYIHLGLLHASLLLRLTGDLAGSGVVRLWGGLLNGIAILLFLLLTLVTILRSRA